LKTQLEEKVMKKHIEKSAWKWIRVAGLALAATLAFYSAKSAGAQSQGGSDPAAVAAAFESAVGSDVEIALGLLSDDATLRIVPPPQGTSGLWAGKEQLKEALKYSKEHAVRRQIVGAPQVQGNTVTYVATVSNDVFQRLGVAPVRFSTEVVVEGGKIRSYASIILPDEQGRVAAAAAKAQQTGAAPGTSAGTAGMPRTGLAGLDHNVLGLAILGILCLLLGAITVRARSKT
jgi:hypothetical protein